MTRKHIEVVAAVVEHDGFYLALQRGKGKSPSTDFKWEFPGGKIEPGEGREEALLRELREELDYDVQIEMPLATVEHAYPDFDITLHTFLCHPVGDAEAFHLKEHHSSVWLRPDELRDPDWCEADLTIIDQLAQLAPDATEEAAPSVGGDEASEPRKDGAIGVPVEGNADDGAPSKRELWMVLAMIVLMALLYFLQRR